MLYLLSALSVIYILLMYYISLLLLPPDGFVLCHIGLLMLTLWRFDDDVISPSPGIGRYNNPHICQGQQSIHHSTSCKTHRSISLGNRMSQKGIHMSHIIEMNNK